MAHTPGPWTAFQDASLRHTVGTTTGRICDMWGQDPAFYTEEDEANARRISDTGIYPRYENRNRQGQGQEEEL